MQVSAGSGALLASITSSARLPQATDHGVVVVVVGSDGYSPSLVPGLMVCEIP